MTVRHGLLAVTAVLLLGGASPLDEGEIHCEEAVRHLDDCCHAPISASYSCYAGRGCDDQRPDLDDPLATQVKDESCQQLVAEGACENPPRTPKPPEPPQSCFLFCNDLSPSPYDLATPDLSPPADFSSVDAIESDQR